MQALRDFWAKSILNKLVIVGLVGVVCCCPVGIAGRGGQGSAAVAPTAAPTVAPTEQLMIELPQPTEAPTEAPAPTEVPAPTEAPTEVPTAAADPAIAAYAQTMGEAGQNIAEGLQGVGESLQSPQVGNERWSVQLAAYTVQVEEGHAAMMAAQPPAGAEELHAAVTDATADCDASMKLLRKAIDARDVNQLQGAAALMTTCTSKMNDAMPLVNEFVEANK